MSCRAVTSEAVDTRRIETRRGVFPFDGANAGRRSFGWPNVVTEGGTSRRLSARPAAIATGTSVTIATATPDTRERCHNDKPCAARRYGGPEPGNRCERFASRGAERSRVRETRISRSQKQASPLHPPLIEIERAWKHGAKRVRKCVLMPRANYLQHASCCCSSSPCVSVPLLHVFRVFIMLMLSYRSDTNHSSYEMIHRLLLRDSPRFVIIARLSVRDIVLNRCFRGFFRRRDNA